LRLINYQTLTKKIYIRVDGSSEIGLGHLVRCIALAQMLKSNFEISFICISIPFKTKEEIRNLNFNLIIIKHEDEILNHIKTKDIVVIDHYKLDLNYHKKLKALNVKVVCVDDIHDKAFDADLIINHAPNANQKNYKSGPNTKYALGIEYALLRPNFLKAAREIDSKKYNTNIFVNFGGSDYLNLGEKVIDILLTIDCISKIQLVIGAANRNHDYLVSKYSNSKIVQIHYAISEKKMISLLKECYFAIVPSSGILFETISLGCYTFSSTYINNQDTIFNGFKKGKMIFPLNSFEDLPKEIICDINCDINFPIVKNSIDGYSGQRLLNLFKNI
jgi:UDP-2,4-diacetamido-2,4,6-trideoxy-beta-L-altropyranose hydrolase